MLSQQLSISSLSWVITRMVLPLRTSLFSLSEIRRIFCPSRPLVDSSRISILRPEKTAQAMGKRIRPDFLSQHFPDFLVAHQMKRIRFHDLHQSALCQWREPEGNSGVAGAQRYQHYKQHLYTFGFLQQGIFYQCPRQDLPGGDKSVKMSRMRGIKNSKRPSAKAEGPSLCRWWGAPAH